jgi:hypothetical protein
VRETAFERGGEAKPPRSDVRRNPREFLAQDQQVHVVGPFVRFDALQVAEVPKALMLFEDPNPSQQVASRMRNFDRGGDVVPLRD